MQIEHCPTLGTLIITTRVKLSSSELCKAQHHQIFSSEPLMPVDTKLVIPLSSAIPLLEQANKVLKQLNHHGSQSMVTGILASQLSQLEVVMALPEQKQRSVENDDLQSRAAMDKQRITALFDKFRPLARKAEQGKVDAEALMQSIRSEPDQQLAINTFRHLIARTHDIHMGDAPIVTSELTPSSTPEFVSKKPYVVDLTVCSINSENGLACCILQGGQNLEPAFQKDDLGRRTLQFQLAHDRLITFGFCMLLGLRLKAQISLRISLTAKGPSYKCALINLLDEEALTSSIRKGIAMQTPDLFSS